MSDKELIEQAKEDGVTNTEEYIIWITAYTRGIEKGAEMYRNLLNDDTIKDVRWKN